MLGQERRPGQAGHDGRGAAAGRDRPGAAAFFQISLLTGQANPVGFFPMRNQVTDIAIPLDQR